MRHWHGVHHDRPSEHRLPFWDSWVNCVFDMLLYNGLCFDDFQEDITWNILLTSTFPSLLRHQDTYLNQVYYLNVETIEWTFESIRDKRKGWLFKSGSYHIFAIGYPRKKTVLGHRALGANSKTWAINQHNFKELYNYEWYNKVHSKSFKVLNKTIVMLSPMGF